MNILGYFRDEAPKKPQAYLQEMGGRLIVLRGRTPQLTVARCVGISEFALSAYEAGIREPRDEVKARIAKYYRKDISDIFPQKGEKEDEEEAGERPAFMGY